jgi:hypothetical protein
VSLFQCFCESAPRKIKQQQQQQHKRNMCTVGWGVQAVQVQEVSFQKRTKKDQYYQNQKLFYTQRRVPEE